MLEMFRNDEMLVLINCAKTIYAIEQGTVNQKELNNVFDGRYTFSEPDCSDIEGKIVGAKYNMGIAYRDYKRMLLMVKEKFPEVDEAYVPFLISDILKETYEFNNLEVK